MHNDDIVVHSSCDVSCDVTNQWMVVTRIHQLHGVTCNHCTLVYCSQQENMYPWCCIFFNPYLQVHKDDVRYHSRDTTESKLERLVKQYSYPPSIKCAVYYSSPRDFDRPSLETFNMTISGTTKHHFSVPIKVYSALGESKCMSMRCVHRQKSPDASVLMCSSL